MYLKSAIENDRYDDFCQGLSNNDYLLEVGEYCGSFFHALAQKKDPEGVSGLFSRKRQLRDYFDAVKTAMIKDRDCYIERVIRVVDGYGDNPLHAAMRVGNWNAAFFLNWISPKIFEELRREKNKGGLSPFVLGALLYGVKNVFLNVDAGLISMRHESDLMLKIKGELDGVRYIKHPDDRTKIIQAKKGDGIFEGLSISDDWGVSEFEVDAAKLKFKEKFGWKKLSLEDLELPDKWPRCSIDSIVKESDFDESRHEEYRRTLADLYVYADFYCRSNTNMIMTLAGSGKYDHQLTKHEAQAFIDCITGFNASYDNGYQYFSAFLLDRYRDIYRWLKN